MRYEGISWNEGWIRSMPEEEFINSPLNADRWTQPGFSIPPAKRKARLRELWRMLNTKEVKRENNKQFIAGNGKSGPVLPDRE